MPDAAPSRAEERQLALLVTGAIDYAIFLLDPSGHVQTWNAGAQRMKGYTRDEIVGRHFSTFYTEEDVARDHPAHELEVALADGRYEEEGWRVRKDGTRFWANVVITPIHDGGTHVGFGKVSRDLTARRLGEEQVRAKAFDLEVANEELGEFRRLVSSVRDYAIFMLDPSGRVRSWNTGARHLKGYEPEEIIGRHFSSFYTAEDRARDHPADELQIAMREGRYEEEGWRVRKDGTTFWAGVTITAVRDEAGRLTGFAKVTRDLTERKAAEEALRHSIDELRAANEELDRFASVAAHDMTDPLRTISGFAELLERAELPFAQVHEYARHIRTSSGRLTGMLQGLLTYARVGQAADVTEAVAVDAAVDRVVADLASLVDGRGAIVEVDVPADVVVAAGPDDVGLILQNLLSNAIKFGDEERPVVKIGAVAVAEGDGGGWRITVEDNGAGIDPAHRERIFIPFQRLHAGNNGGGHGLGLAICQRLVSLRGGTLGVEAAGEGGSRFWFALPAAAGAPRRAR
jgi:PAS domain S-box-containing protein